MLYHLFPASRGSPGAAVQGRMPLLVRLRHLMTTECLVAGGQAGWPVFGFGRLRLCPGHRVTHYLV